ncbi:MAG: hypothetical protein A2X67_02335 [Ignavibacteria bacterium GWA2_55_11]|nr:MAG: hypothetical protein A2X67_02335 [Ignavibacteria bacterium GWA2_55_11]OGU47732.1 MAG: hypothetical protein A2X68_01425 [Ignavibacteria bacterium GWC2_56_12]OGU68087.1 MAG: hypothetical protein A3C56_06985 [Ignavibacteria bacterium RIFCSPHIGHO2_02_FULL_56_12]OGU70494.1 MAG: hypothetical protein A3G43_03360 [Ignavibacteria bacterium RIFCSPLOWO2_12_FULL_56_21]OGU73945.1 MAG: hypothetical protein A3H45_14920 [Ignavibacteria bacterium RIFCSPLOWO2_02_FULL_55_14]HAV22930.1 ABC transporter per
MNLAPIVRKEFRQISRDRRALGILVFLPGLLLVLVGYALNFDVKNLSVAVVDEDRSPESRHFVQSLTGSEYLVHKWSLDDRSGIDRLLEEGEAQVALVIPRGFAHAMIEGKSIQVQVIVDGANANTAAIAAGYVALGIQDYSSRVLAQWLERHGAHILVPIDIRPRLLFNPELKTAKYLVPGLFGLILMLSTVISTSLSVVREKELGTMEQLKTSPLKAYEIIIGKAVPYLGIALLAATLILVLGWLMFDVSVRGSLLVLYVAIFIFLLAGLGQGLVISSVAKNQQIAFFISVFSSLLPAFLLSGFVFPLSSMPMILQVIANILPTKYFLVIVRAVILKGVGIGPVWDQFLALSLFSAFAIGLSSIRLHRELSS